MFVAYCVAFHQPSCNSHTDQRQRPFVRSESLFQSAHQQDSEIFSSCCKTAGAIALSTLLTLSPFALDLTTPDFDFPLTSTTTTTTSINRNNHLFRIRKPSAWALTEEQLLVDNVWREVNRQYVDQSFNKLGEEGWRKERLKAVKEVSNVGPDEKEFVYSTIRNMLAVLGDPYTRFLTPDQFESLTAYARGGATPKAGIGVQLIADPATGKILVLNVIPDGPAAKGGILPGDVIFQVDYDDMSGSTAEVVAAKCRGETGTEVTLAIQHGSEDGNPKTLVENFSLTRSQIKTNTVKTSTFSSNSGKKVGLIRVSSFNLETEKLVREALEEIRKESSVSSLVIDLRGNGGGYMPAGVDVAKLFLPAKARIISEVDKTGRSTIYISDGVGSDTNMQLYLLVDQRTASASEILTAALQDNHRATIVGTKTFGKG
jgi:carboxyl-terminal processing protease